MATGYCEELFFRSYLMRRLAQAGLPRIWTAIASSLLFGSGHGYQGVVGLVSGSLLGLYFAWRWDRARNIHEIALGHGLFDAVVFAALPLYLSFGWGAATPRKSGRRAIVPCMQPTDKFRTDLDQGRPPRRRQGRGRRGRGASGLLLPLLP